MKEKFEIKSDKTGKFHFNLSASNGQIILTSEVTTASDRQERDVHDGQRNGEWHCFGRQSRTVCARGSR